MNVGIIVCSKTGNTLSVAEQIGEELRKNDNKVTIERFTMEIENQRKASARLSAAPDPNEYEAVIFGAPVQAFSLDPGMSLYIQQTVFTKQMPVLCFITQHFKKPWLGGNQAMKKLRMLLRQKDISAQPIGIINWSHEKRNEQIAFIAQNCAEALREESK